MTQIVYLNQKNPWASSIDGIARITIKPVENNDFGADFFEYLATNFSIAKVKVYEMDDFIHITEFGSVNDDEAVQQSQQKHYVRLPMRYYITQVVYKESFDTQNQQKVTKEVQELLV